MRWRALLLLALAGCAPAFDADPARVEGPRVLAVRAEPAEAAPGEGVALEALVVGAEAPPAWAWCTAPRPAAEPRVAAAACLTGDAAALRPLGAGPTLEAAVPADACARFGSDPPPAPPGEPPPRPADPDATGGYHQPLRVTVDGGPATLARVRLRCALPGAPVAVARRYAAEARPNAHPTLTDFAVVPAGDALRLIARWPEAAAETYLRYDATTGTLDEAAEVLTATVYVDGGAVEAPRRTATTLEVRWTPGDGAHAWVVLRDDRGGVVWATVDRP